MKTMTMGTLGKPLSFSRCEIDEVGGVSWKALASPPPVHDSAVVIVDPIDKSDLPNRSQSSKVLALNESPANFLIL